MMILKSKMFVIYGITLFITFVSSAVNEKGYHDLLENDDNLVSEVENNSVDWEEQQWKDFKLKYNKTYPTEKEEEFRMKIYLENIRLITEHNRLYENGLVLNRMKENKFADLSPDEFSPVMNAHARTLSPNTTSTFVPPENIELPESFDWREKGAVTPVKDQEKCSSCWAFSAVACLESHHFLKTKRLVNLSEQNLIDCTETYGNYGCGGGFIDRAFDYVKQNGGIDTESSYPYEAGKKECRYNPKNSGTTIVGYRKIRSGNESDLKAAVATVGPISVLLDATHQSFRFYEPGDIYYEPECSTEIYNHALLVVGYGSDNGKDFWIVKNSWGDDWGNEGYINIARNKDSHCGIATRAVYPLM